MSGPLHWNNLKFVGQISEVLESWITLGGCKLKSSR